MMHSRLIDSKDICFLKQQHRTRTKAVMPPETDFTEHYRTHYQLGAEEPLEVVFTSCIYI